MPVILPDLSQPLDYTGVDVREDVFGNTEAFCPGCGAWMRIAYKTYCQHADAMTYQGDRKLIVQLPHTHPCEYSERIRMRLFGGTRNENNKPDTNDARVQNENDIQKET